MQQSSVGDLSDIMQSPQHRKLPEEHRAEQRAKLMNPKATPQLDARDFAMPAAEFVISNLIKTDIGSNLVQRGLDEKSDSEALGHKGTSPTLSKVCSFHTPPRESTIGLGITGIGPAPSHPLPSIPQDSLDPSSPRRPKPRPSLSASCSPEQRPLPSRPSPQPQPPLSRAEVVRARKLRDRPQSEALIVRGGSSPGYCQIRPWSPLVLTADAYTHPLMRGRPELPRPRHLILSTLLERKAPHSPDGNDEGGNANDDISLDSTREVLPATPTTPRIVVEKPRGSPSASPTHAPFPHYSTRSGSVDGSKGLAVGHGQYGHGKPSK